MNGFYAAARKAVKPTQLPDRNPDSGQVWQCDPSGTIIPIKNPCEPLLFEHLARDDEMAALGYSPGEDFGELNVVARVLSRPTPTTTSWPTVVEYVDDDDTFVEIWCCSLTSFLRILRLALFRY